MIGKKSNIFDLLNPCQISESDRHQAFIESDASNYSPNGEIRFTLPSDENLDMTECYIDLICQLNLTDPEVSTIYQLDMTGSTGGEYRFTYKGRATIPIAHNAAPAVLQSALEQCPTIGGAFYSVSVTGAYPIYNIEFFDFDNYSEVFGSNSALSYEKDSALGIDPTLFRTQVGSFNYPRLEYLAPVVSEFRIDIDSHQIISITNYNILSAILEMSDTVDSTYPKYSFNSQFPQGYYNPNQFRIKLNIKAIGFLHKLLPMKYLNSKIKLYIKLENASRCLIQGPSLGGTYSIDTPRLHYHRVELTSRDKRAIITALYGDEKKGIKPTGIVIPFKNWYNYSDTISVGSSSKNIIFNPAVSNLLGVLFVMQPQDYIADPENERKLSVYLRNRIGKYRLKIGSKYFPLDQIDSLTTGEDQVEPITELEHFLEQYDYVRYDRILYFNFAGQGDGNDPNSRIFNWQFDSEYAPTWVGAISTSDSPHDMYGHICLSDAMSGQDVSSESNVSLEIKDLNLLETNTFQLYALHQDFLIFEAGKPAVWKK